MREVMLELKQLRLQGMAAAWTDQVERGSHAELDSPRWLLAHLLSAKVGAVSELLCLRPSETFAPRRSALATNRTTRWECRWS